jgi:predicted transcriptional regulator
MLSEDLRAIELLGNSPNVRVLLCLRRNSTGDFSYTEIGTGSNLTRQTVKKVMDRLLKFNMVIPSREFGSVTLYKYNFKSPAAIKFSNLVTAISDRTGLD